MDKVKSTIGGDKIHDELRAVDRVLWGGKRKSEFYSSSKISEMLDSMNKELPDGMAELQARPKHLQIDHEGNSESLEYTLSMRTPSMGLSQRYITDISRPNFLSKIIIHPYGSFRVCWDIIVAAMLISMSFSLPFILAFDVLEEECTTVTLQGRLRASGSPIAWCMWEMLCELVFAVDIVLNFTTAYFIRDLSEGYVLVTAHRRIIWHYLTGLFVFDLVGSLPWSLIMPPSSGGGADGAIKFMVFFRSSRLMKLMKLVRLLKLARLGKLQKLTDRLKDRLNLNPGVFKLLELFSITVLMLHFGACAAYFIADISGYRECTKEMECEPGLSWATAFHVAKRNGSSNQQYAAPVTDLHEIEQYLVALYWVLTTFTTIGYGDVTPKNLTEIFFACIVMAVGATMFAYIVGNIASALANTDPNIQAYRERLQRLNASMTEMKLHPQIRQRVREFIEYKYCHQSPGEHLELYNDLPKSLEAQVALSLYKGLLDAVPFFKGRSARLRQALVLQLKLHMLGPCDVMLEAGSRAEAMWFVSCGWLEVSLYMRGSPLYCQLEAGDYMGGAAFIRFYHRPEVFPKSTVSVISGCFCDVYSIKFIALLEILDENPKEKKEVITMIQERNEGAIQEANSSTNVTDEGSCEPVTSGQQGMLGLVPSAPRTLPPITAQPSRPSATVLQTDVDSTVEAWPGETGSTRVTDPKGETAELRNVVQEIRGCLSEFSKQIERQLAVVEARCLQLENSR
jgi:hypothetical protein